MRDYLHLSERIDEFVPFRLVAVYVYLTEGIVCPRLFESNMSLPGACVSDNIYNNHANC